MTPPPRDVAVVPVALVDEILGTVAAVLHDRPVQSLVAARLLIETAVAPDPASELVQRGLEAITTAAEQSRDVMWALTRPEVRQGSLAEDIVATLDRGSDPRSPARVSVALDEGVDPTRVQALASALHLVVVEVRFAGGHLSAVRVESDAEGLRAEVHADAGSVDAVWVRLAAARLADVGGQVRPVGDRGVPGLVLVLAVPDPAGG